MLISRLLAHLHIFHLSGLICSHLAYLDISGRICLYLGISGRIWTHLGVSAYIWAYQGAARHTGQPTNGTSQNGVAAVSRRMASSISCISEHICTYLDISGRISLYLAYLSISARIYSIWTYLGVPAYIWHIWIYPGMLCAPRSIWQYLPICGISGRICAFLFISGHILHILYLDISWRSCLYLAYLVYPGILCAPGSIWQYLPICGISGSICAFLFISGHILFILATKLYIFIYEVPKDT